MKTNKSFVGKHTFASFFQNKAIPDLCFLTIAFVYAIENKNIKKTSTDGGALVLEATSLPTGPQP